MSPTKSRNYGPPISHLIQISSQRDWNGVPSSIRKLLTPDERRTFQDRHAVLAELAAQCRYKPLRSLLTACSECDDFDLQLFRWDRRPFQAYFRFTLSEGPDPAIRLAPKKEAKHDFPSFLSQIYEIVDCIHDNAFEYAGGMLSPGQISPMGSMGPWIAAENKLDASEYRAFIHTLGGDFLCFHPNGKGAWYHHEVGKLQAVPSLEVEVKRYLLGLVSGERFSPL